MTVASTRALEVFFSYAHEDERLLKQLNSHLSSLKHEGRIFAWHDRDINAGANWSQEIDARLNTADIILLLISSDFMDSNYCYSIEAKQALERHAHGEARVIPIILKPVDWQHTPIGELQALPPNAKPVTSWPDRNKAFTEIARGLRKAIEEMTKARLVSQRSKRLWHLPYEHNPFYTGDHALFKEIHDALETRKRVILSGLGGIGKTQTAIEYAYHYRDAYQVVLWARADSHELLTTDITSFVGPLELVGTKEQDQGYALSVVQQWLRGNANWLLIVDNIEDLNWARELIPSDAQGHLLFTAQAPAVGTLHGIEIKEMNPEQGAVFLLRRSRWIGPHDSYEQVPETEYAAAKEIAKLMGGLPLALDQAGAYIERIGCSPEDYWRWFEQRESELLKRRVEASTGHPEPVTTTLSLAMEKIEHVSPAAMEILTACAFLHPDAIPEEIIVEGAADLGPIISALAGDPLALNEAIGTLRGYSLIHRHPASKTLTVHRLVQAILKDKLPETMQCQWAERVVQTVNTVFPEVEFSSWQRCQRYISQVQVCAALIEHWHISSLEAARLLDEAGHYLYEQARYAEAEPLLERARAIREQTVGSEHLDMAKSLNHLAELYQVQAKYAQSEPLFQQALVLREKLLGEEHTEVATSYNNLALLYQAQGKYNQAESLHQRALQIRQNILGTEHSDIGTSLHNLANLYLILGKYAQAESLFQQARTIKEQVLGPEHPEVGTILDHLGNLYMSLGKYAQAESLLQQARAIYEQVLGSEHPEVATTLGNLANLYYKLGKYAQAESLFQQAHLIEKQVLGSEHPSVATTLVNLANLYMSLGKYAQAESLLQQARAIYEQVLGSEHPSVGITLNNLANPYRKQGKYAEAESLLQQARAIEEQSLGSEHPEVATTLGNLANLYLDQGDHIQARQYYQQARAIHEQALGPEHPEVATTLGNLANLYYKLGNYIQARMLYEQSLKIREKVMGSKHLDVAHSLNGLAALYTAQRRYTQAEPFYQRTLKIREQTLGEEHPNTISTMKNYATMLRYANRNTKAAELEAHIEAIQAKLDRENLIG